MSDYELLRPELTLACPASAEAVARLQEEFGRQVPDEYLAFLSAHDGAEGALGVIAGAIDVARGVDLYPGLEHLHEFVIFGNDGGGEAFGFAPDGHVVVVPWIGGQEDAIPQGTFTEFLTRLIAGRLFERNG